MKMLARLLGAIAACSVVAGAHAAPPVYNIVVLPLPADGISAQVLAVNNSGAAAGTYYDGSKLRALTWDASSHAAQVLAQGSGGADARAIADSGVVGGQQDSRSHDVAVRWTGGRRAERLTSPVERWQASYVTDINTSGTAVGNMLTLQQQNIATRWAPDGSATVLVPQDLAITSGATAINESGLVGGAWLPSEGGSYRPYLWSAASGRRDLPALPGARYGGGVQDVDEAGTAVGSAYGADDLIHAVIWPAGGGIQPLVEIAGASVFSADSLNAAGQVVGSMHLASGKATSFWWTAADGMHDLRTLIALTDPNRPQGTQRVVAKKINDSGVIAATIQSDAGYTVDVPVLLVPQP